MEEVHPGAVWAEKLGAIVMDPDGWDRACDDYHTLPITQEDFDRRLRESTTGFHGYPHFGKVL